MGDRRGIFRVLVRKSDGKRPLGRPRRKLEANIKLVSRKWNVVVWTGSSWPRIETGGGHL